MDKMSVAEFVAEFVVMPVPVEVNVFVGKNSGVMTYIGCETNWEAFKKHLEGFTNVEVNDITIEDGKLIINGIL